MCSHHVHSPFVEYSLPSVGDLGSLSSRWPNINSKILSLSILYIFTVLEKLTLSLLPLWTSKQNICDRNRKSMKSYAI